MQTGAPDGEQKATEERRRPTTVDPKRPKEILKTNLTHKINGTRVIVSGKCSFYPCTKGGWRCHQCVKVLEQCYQTIIQGLQDEHKAADLEVSERRAREPGPCGRKVQTGP